MVASIARTRSGGRGASASGKGAAYRFKASLAAGCVLILAESAAFAQAPPPPQPVAPTREQVQPPPAETRPAPARLTVEGEIEHAPCALDRPEYQNIRFTLRDVVFDNLRGLPAARLREAFADHVGQETGVAAICEIRDRAAAILRDAGYVAAVEVPEQHIADGVVHFQVLMAKLVGIRVRGDAGRAERLIASYLNKLTEQEVFNRYDAERYLLLAGDLPGYRVRLALRSAGAARGEVIGEVTVEHVPLIADATVQNLGSQSLGRWGALARVQIFGLTGLGDRTTLAAYSTADTREQQTVQIGHDFRIGGEGLTFGGQLTYSWARPDLGNPAIDIRSRTLFATLEASYPFIRRQSRTLRGALGMDLVDQDISFNAIPLNRDHLRVAFARLDFDASGLVRANPLYTLAEPRWRFSGDVELRRGLDIFGATRPCGPALVNCTAVGLVTPTRLEGDPTATLLRGAAYGEFRPVPRVTLALGVRGQYSRDPLLSFEEYSAGNYTIGRGYDPGALLGDSGVGVQAELRFGSAVPRAENEFRAEPYVFVDQAWVWNRDRIFAIPDEELTSVGGGIRAAFGSLFRIDALVAFPLDRAPLQARRSDPRFLVTLTTRLWPWRSR
jgi:hemolysin activation/secretion protein